MPNQPGPRELQLRAMREQSFAGQKKKPEPIAMPVARKPKPKGKKAPPRI